MTAPAALSLAVAVTGVLGFMVRLSLSPLPLLAALCNNTGADGGYLGLGS